MAGINLVQDDGGARVQVLRPDDSTTVSGTSTATDDPVRLALPANSRVIEITARADIHWQFGNSAVNGSTSNKLQLAGTLIYAVPSGATHLSFVAAAGVTSAPVTVTRMY